MRVPDACSLDPGGHPDGEAYDSLGNGRSHGGRSGAGVACRGALLVELADRVGLTGAMSEALAGTRERRSAHDPGRVLRDVAVMLADGGDCVTDLDAYRGQERLFGARASETTTHRVLKAIDEQLLARVRAARAEARARVWDAGARPETITLNIDATLADRAFGEGAGGRQLQARVRVPSAELLSGRDRRGARRDPADRGTPARTPPRITSRCSGSRSRSCPAEDLDREILVRTDIGGQTHAFTADCREAGIRFSVGYELTETVRAAILEVPEAAWVQAINGDGDDRDGAWVAELTDRIDLSAWPEGSRLIFRRERPHPGAQFTIFDEHGYRYTCFLTDQDGNDIAVLELRHRGRARVEDSIRCGKDTGMRNLPHHAFEHNQTWLELSLIAQDLLCWTKLICLTGELATAEPKRLRQRLLHIAAKLVRHGRRTHLKLDRDWPWADSARRRVRAPPGDPSALLSAKWSSSQVR